jgi:hypothetical protein
MGFLIGVAIAASAPSTASATIVFTAGNFPQVGEEVVYFADQAPATTVVGVSTTNPSNSLSVKGTTSIGSQLEAVGGHVQPPPGAAIDTLTITPSSLLDLLIFDRRIFGAYGTPGAITYTVRDNHNNSFVLNTTLGNGNNFFTISAEGGEAIQSVSLSAPSGFTDASSFGAIFLPAAPVPEPGTWAMMLMGFTLIGWIKRRKRRATELYKSA